MQTEPEQQHNASHKAQLEEAKSIGMLKQRLRFLGLATGPFATKVR